MWRRNQITEHKREQWKEMTPEKKTHKHKQKPGSRPETNRNTQPVKTTDNPRINCVCSLP